METTRGDITYYRFSQILFLMGVFAKQFYVLPSGSFQIGDALFILSFLVSVFCRDRGGIRVQESEKPIIWFVVCVTIINIIYICIYGFSYEGSSFFHLSIFYYLYNLLIILGFRQFCEDRRFLRDLGIVLKTGLIIQTVILVTHTGKYFDYRFMGTFNDPNQCGFFLMMSFFMIYMIAKINQERFTWIWLLIYLYLTMETSSTGMVLGFGVFLAFYLFNKLSEHNMKSAIALLVFVALVFIAIVLVQSGIVQLPESITESFMYKRVMEKLFRFGIGEDAGSTDTFRGLMLDRCWDKLFYHPENILYGAGEGNYGRFQVDSWTLNEIHSSLLGPLFYYGIIPCALWFFWTARQLKGIKKEFWCVYFALFVESLTLVNNRQPFFWMIFVLAGSSLAKREEQPGIEEISGERYAFFDYRPNV